MNAPFGTTKPMKPQPMDAYVDAGCAFYANSRPGFAFVWIEAKGDVCTTGCAWFDSGRCPAYRKLTIPAKATAQQEPMESVRDTAKRLGISISEVRRRRRQAGDSSND